MQASPSQKSLVFIAWAVILVAALPKIILQEIFAFQVSANLQTAIGVAVGVIGLALAFGWKTLHPLRQFFGLFLALLCAEWLVYTKIDQLPAYQTWLHDPSFNVYMLAEQSLRLMVTLTMIAVLFGLKKKAEAFFLVKGETAAPVEPVRWLGTKPGETWRSFGRNFAIFLSLGTLAFLVIAGRPPLDLVIRALPFLPAVLLAAALNAFNEEMTYKASFLSVLEGAVGKNQSLWLMAAYFGLGHYYGIPYGLVGVLMATFLGWLLGKSMLETRGLFWAWFLHFWQDVLIFSFLAIGSIIPGGG
jgi:hypothetical protein